MLRTLLLLKITILLISSITSARTSVLNEQVIHAKFQKHIEKTKVLDFMRKSKEKHRASGKKENLALDLRETGAMAALQKEGLTLAPSSVIDFIMAENPSTGYSWQVDKESGAGLWKIESEEYVYPQESDGVGVPGLKKVTVRVNDYKEGRSMFRAIHARPWEFKGWKKGESVDKSQVNERDLVVFQIKVEKIQSATESEL